MLDAVKELDKLVLVSAGIFHRLGAMRFKTGCTREPTRTLTKRRTPMPVKIRFAGGNA
jgi:hypothetical protein